MTWGAKFYTWLLMKWPTPDPDNDMTWKSCFLLWLMCLGMCLSLAVLFQVMIWATPNGWEQALLPFLSRIRFNVFYVMIPMTFVCVIARYMPGKARMKEERRQKWLALKDEFENE